jgi:hypothetical protein
MPCGVPVDTFVHKTYQKVHWGIDWVDSDMLINEKGPDRLYFPWPEKAI